MIVNRKKLITALALVQPGLASSEIIEQSKSFIFRDGNVFTYDDTIAMSHPIDLPFECAVPSLELSTLLNKAKDEELGFELTEGVLYIVGKKFSAELRCNTKITLPVIDTKPDVWWPLPANFIEAVKSSMFTVGKDVTKPILTCLNIHDTTMESCDNFRLTRYKLSAEMPLPMYLPGKSARQLVRYSPVSYYTSEGWAHFLMDGDVMFSCRVFSGAYPDLSPLLELKGVTTISFPPNMEAMLDRAQSVKVSETGLEQAVNITIQEGQLSVFSEGKSGKFAESTRMKDKGEAVISFNINIEFLKQILSEVREAELSEDLGKLKFTSTNFSHVIALASD